METVPLGSKRVKLYNDRNGIQHNPKVSRQSLIIKEKAKKKH